MSCKILVGAAAKYVMGGGLCVPFAYGNNLKRTKISQQIVGAAPCGILH